MGLVGDAVVTTLILGDSDGTWDGEDVVFDTVPNDGLEDGRAVGRKEGAVDGIPLPGSGLSSSDGCEEGTGVGEKVLGT